jgi:serralysin
MAQQARGDFHDWTINEIYSNADGTVQFIELACSAAGETFLGGERISCSQGNQTNIFTFPDDLTGSTVDKKLLLATPGFGSLPGGIPPDFVIPTNFLFVSTGRVNYAGLDILTYTNLPTNGTASLRRSSNRFVIATNNSPENFSSQTGFIVPVRILSILGQPTNAIVSFATAPGKNYAVQFRDSLTNSAWQTATTVAGNGTIRTVTNTAGLINKRFYRLRVP